MEFDENRDLAPLKGIRYILNLNTNEPIYFVLKLLFSEAKKSNIYKHLLVFIIASIIFHCSLLDGKGKYGKVR